MDQPLLKEVVVFAPGAHFGNESPPNRLRDLIVHDFGASDTDFS